jgi:hypothetical protein
VDVGCWAASSDVAKASANVGRHDAKEMFFLTSWDDVNAMFVLLMHLCRHVDELEEVAAADVARSEKLEECVAWLGDSEVEGECRDASRLRLEVAKSISAASSGVALVRNPRWRDRDKRAQVYKHNRGCKMLVLPPAMQLCPQLAHATVREKSKAFTSGAKAR